MPDFSPYSPDKPFVPTFFSKVNLNDAFVPSVTVPEVGKSSDIGSGEDNNPWSFFLKSTGRNPFSNLGIVPAGPAATTDYFSNRKFTSEADSYQSGSTYKDIGFLIGRDNENLFAKNRSFWDESFNTAVRLLDKAGAYTLQGFGFLGGLVGIGNDHNNYSNGSGFANWIAGASDNALSAWSKDFADNVDNYYRPIYQDAEDRDKGFFKRMLTDSEFWKGDAVDGVAFLGSAYLTGNLGQVANLGGKAVRGVAALRGLNFADEAAALSAEGLSGVSEATNLSKGATAAESGAPLTPNAFSSNAGKVFSRYAEEAGNFENARRINMGVSTLINTASESMFEADNLKHEVIDKLSTEKNPDGTYKYTPDEVKSIAAGGAKNSFLLNMIVLPISNLWEARIFYGKANPLSARNINSNLVRRATGLLDNAELLKRTFGQKGLDYLKGIGTGILAEGLWEENIQLAIERMNQDEENIDGGFFRNIGKVINQYGKQTTAALRGNDPEAAMNIGLGGLIGGVMGGHERYHEIGAIKKDVANYNAQINAFRTTAKDLYEKNTDGSVRLDKNNQPVVNPTNVLSYISSLNKTLNVSELADNLKEKHLDILHSIVDNENISRLVKAYADNGMSDDLIKKLEDYKGYKQEDLMLLGLNPDKVSASQRIDDIKKKVIEYKNIYDNIEKNFFVKIKNDDKYGTKTKLMKDKLYYLSTRAKNLSDLQKNLDTKTETTISDISLRFTGENDSLTDKLNDLWSTYSSAKKRVDYLSIQQRELGFTRGIETIETRAVETRKKKKKSAPQEKFTAVDEQDLSDAVSAMTIADKNMRDFLEENKDTIKHIQKNADGTYRYDIPEKNKLMYDEGIVKNQNISKDLETAKNATLNVYNRLSDIKYGERYFDQVYSKRKQELQDEVINDETENLDENLEDEPIVPPTPEGPASEAVKEPEIRSTEDYEDRVEELNKLKREKEALEGKEDSTLEDDVNLDEINKRINDLEDVFGNIDDARIGEIIGGSGNIPDVKKEEYQKVLEAIEENKRRVIKRDGYYEVDGERYSKVSDIIGNVVPDDLRPTLQNALTAGYTIDSIVKAYFDQSLHSIKDDIATKISEEAYNKLIKQLDVVRNKLRDDGVEIVATNVQVFDPVLKVAGEIDILAVDKKGNFKIYEVEARQSRIWSQIATKTGKGPAIYDMSQKQLSSYRNLFANQYGIVPTTIAVMFPVDVKYDKENPSGFIEKVNLKQELRFTPTNNVQIKSNVFQPIRIGSKYDGFDLTSLYINSFIPQSLEIAKEKFRFLLRNESFDKIKQGVQIKIKEAEQRFQDLYNNQQKVIAGEVVDGYKITPILNAPNLYALKGNKEISIIYNGQTLGFMQPSPTLAYKDENDVFHVLDENTDLDTYKKVTGNSEQTYNEFKNISEGYKTAYAKLTGLLEGKEEAIVLNKDAQDMFDIQMSYGELDLVNVGQARPILNDLVVNGVKVGNKSVVTVIHMDENDIAKVMMDRSTKSKTSTKKLYEIDNWTIKNTDKIKEALNNKRGERVTDYAAVIETPNGQYHLISLRLMKGEKLSTTEDYVTDLGTKFTASVSKNVFKNESISMIPKKGTGEVSINLKGSNIVSEIYVAEDINNLEKMGLDINQVSTSQSVHENVNNFIKEMGDIDFKKVNSMFAAYELTKDELISEILDDFNSGQWSSIDDYLENLKCDL